MAVLSLVPSDPFECVSKLDDPSLTAQLQQLNQRKHLLDAELLLHLSELDRRGLYRNVACSSLFAYCVERLGFSEDVAYKRVGVARMLRLFPLLLVDGRIHLSALLLLKPLLNEPNHTELLHSACGLSKREVEKLVAAHAPRPGVPAQVRKLPEPRPAAAFPAPSPIASPTLTPNASLSLPPAHPPVPPSPLPTPRAEVQPLSARSYRVVFTATDTLKQKLDRARELTSHAVSPSDLPALLERALDLLIEREEQRRFALHGKKRTEPPPQRDPGRVRPGPTRKPSRYVPAEVRRVVWKRDRGQCAFVDVEGHRCGERHYLEVEHKQPHALRGPPTIDNCELLCKAHNALRAEEVFGRAVIVEKIEGKRRVGASPGTSVGKSP